MDKLSEMVKNASAKDLWYELRPEIRSLALHMELKFRMHDEERGDPFQPCEHQFLIARQFEEMTEFEEMMMDGKTPLEVLREGADVCNILLMRIEHYKRERIEKAKQRR